MKQTQSVEIHNINKKAIWWWRSLSKDMKKTMLHNPNVTRGSIRNVALADRSTGMQRKMLRNWLSWEINTNPEKDEHPKFRMGAE